MKGLDSYGERNKRPSKSYNEQQNMSEFAEEAETLRPEKAKEFPPNNNNISKHVNK